MVRPVLWSGAKTLEKVTLRTGGDILTDIARSTEEVPWDIFSRRVNETVQNMIRNLRGRGRKRKAGDRKAARIRGLQKKISSPK